MGILFSKILKYFILNIKFYLLKFYNIQPDDGAITSFLSDFLFTIILKLIVNNLENL